MSTKACRACLSNFEIRAQDIDFYRMMEVPPPTLCYFCRMIRRLSFRNERNLYHRTCSLTGKPIISAFSPDKPFPVFDLDAWWSDEWDPLSFGRPPDFSRPFFRQFAELMNKVPRLALQQQRPMENSQYCNCASQNKNCYLVFSTNRCEDCYFGSWVNDSKNCIDNLNVKRCELCYECIDCYDCYQLFFSQECSSCSESAFLKNCISCRHCLFSVNLVNKDYYLFNRPCSKEEYESTMKKLGSHASVEKFMKGFFDFCSKAIVKEYFGTQNENVVGNYLDHCRNAFMSFECSNAEDIAYSMCLDSAKDSYDHSYWGGKSERLYECQACGYDLFNLRFCNLCWTNCRDLLYCDHCFSSNNCFGCVGLKKKEYCIFNMQYSKEDYENLKNKLIEHMKKTGEWGEFFPSSISHFAYNESLASEHLPLSKDEVLKRGWKWKEREELFTFQGTSWDIPDRIEDLGDDVLKKTITCPVTGRKFKIISQELQFLKQYGICLPRLHPDERHRQRLLKRLPRRLFSRTCMKCQKAIVSPYREERTEQVYCEKCYLEAVY